MENNLINICYEGNSGASDIRTCYINEILHFSLSDVFVTLNKENMTMGENNPPRNIPLLIKSLLNDLDEDEFSMMPHPNPTKGLEFETFVTQPGLNRIMGSDDSPAGRKFQRWLYHDVVPSLTKHGMYPPPQTPQGSALSQMAEIIAQNSRALADSIITQEKLEHQVSQVKDEIVGVGERILKLENHFDNNENILSVKNWFDKENMPLSQNKELEIVTWCENISLQEHNPRQACPSGIRVKAKFYSSVIVKAKELVEQARG